MDTRHRRLPLRTGWGLALALAGLTVWLGFEQGGYFADTTAWAAVAVAIALALSAAIWGRPPEGLTRGVAWAGGFLGLFVIWVLLSGSWSEAEGRALIEFDRALLYVLVLLLFGVAAEPRLTLGHVPVAFSLAALVLCGAGFLARTLPEQWPFADPTLASRLDFPLSYPNAVGALAALGLVMSLHVACWERRHTVLRCLAAAALPVLASTLVLTFSRGAAVAVVLGVVVYLALGWSPGLPSAILAGGPAVALAVVTSLDAELITSDAPRTAAALSEGEDLAAIVALAAVCAAILLAMLSSLERRVANVASRISGRAVVVGAAAVLGVAALSVVATGSLDDIDPIRGGTDDSARDDGALRERLTPAQVVDLGAQNRPKYWRVAREAFQEEPLRGHGAGRYQKLWAQERPVYENVTEGHSVYLETAAELGLVGLGLLLAGLGLIVAAFVRGLRRSRRPLYAGLLAAAVVWLAHAGIDWDWEMPALTVWLFAAGGCALAAPPARPRESSSPRGSWARWLPRAAVVGGLLVLALTPVSVGLSQARLDDSAESFQRGDCGRAERSALDSISALDSRPEPYTFLAYCAVREGQPRRAVAQMRLALERDPDAWDLYYGLALMRGAARLDPRPAALAALRRNPLEPVLQEAVEGFATSNPRAWERYATAAPLPLVEPADAP